MNLKEAFHYQNTLSTMITSIGTYFSGRSNVVRVDQVHLRAAADASLQDEQVDATAERPYDCSNNDMVALYLILLGEKEELSKAIHRAKSEMDFALDNELALNRTRQEMAKILTYMSKIKVGERTTYANGYRFNAEGNQVPYRYDVKETTSIDFDRNLVKSNARRLTNVAGEVSKRADRYMVEVELKDFVPHFGLDDTLEDAVELFMETTYPKHVPDESAEQSEYERRYERHAV